MMTLLLPAAFLTLASLVTLSSVSTHFFSLQLAWVFLGVLIIALFSFFDWRPIMHYRWLVPGFYNAIILALLLVLVSGPLIRETRSWIVLGEFTLQPVELMKIALVFVYARYFSRKHVSIASWRTILGSFLYFAFPAALVMLQPDLGSTLVLFGIWFVFLLVSGLPPKRIVVASIVFIVFGFGLWMYGLKGYQRERIVSVFYPQHDVLGINYSVTQSKIAIGSAGFWGKGYSQGTQTQLGFLTEPEGDFILAAFIEEWGWFFGGVLTGMFLALVLGILRIGSLAEQNFEKFICLGTAIIFTIQFFLNAGSALGISPVIGVTFPFLSYGGSSILTSFTLLAIVNAIGRKL